MKGWDYIGENPNCWMNKGVDYVIADPPILYELRSGVLSNGLYASMFVFGSESRGKEN